jgi:hypothetical protein
MCRPVTLTACSRAGDLLMEQMVPLLCARHPVGYVAWTDLVLATFPVTYLLIILLLDKQDLLQGLTTKPVAETVSLGSHTHPQDAPSQ